MNEYHKCHKCGGEGVCRGSQEVGYTYNGFVQIEHDYECEDCGATWDVNFELTPRERDNHES